MEFKKTVFSEVGKGVIVSGGWSAREMRSLGAVDQRYKVFIGEDR